MKTILCFGDSITWGYNPADATRFPFEKRWPGILQMELGDSVRVIEEALPGRTTNWDSPYLPDRNGGKRLPMILETHAPVDIFILMLGTNDLWRNFNLSASDIAGSCVSLIWTVQKSMAGPEMGAPEILLIAPYPLGKLSQLMKCFFEGRSGVSRQLAGEYRKVSQSTGCRFLDSSKYVKASNPDGVHLNESGHGKLALGVKKSIAPLIG